MVAVNISIIKLFVSNEVYVTQRSETQNMIWLTQQSSFFLENLIVAQLVKQLSTFMEIQGSSSFLQKPPISPNLQPK